MDNKTSISYRKYYFYILMLPAEEYFLMCKGKS